MNGLPTGCDLYVLPLEFSLESSTPTLMLGDFNLVSFELMTCCGQILFGRGQILFDLSATSVRAR